MINSNSWFKSGGISDSAIFREIMDDIACQSGVTKLTGRSSFLKNIMEKRRVKKLITLTSKVQSRIEIMTWSNGRASDEESEDAS